MGNTGILLKWQGGGEDYPSKITYTIPLTKSVFKTLPSGVFSYFSQNTNKHLVLVWKK